MRAPVRRIGTLASLLFMSTNAMANEHSDSYSGIWHFKSAGGYSGVLVLDQIGGCSYSVASVALSIQATCVARELDDGKLVIFGTQEGTSSAAPVYGDQSNSVLPTYSTSTTVTFNIEEIEQTKMTGSLIIGASEESARFSR